MDRSALLAIAAEMARYNPEDHDDYSVAASLRGWAMRINTIVNTTRLASDTQTLMSTDMSRIIRDRGGVM